MPLMNSVSECYQTIVNYRINQCECEEKHSVRPFSHDGSGAVTSVTQTLDLLNEEPIDRDNVGAKSASGPQSTLLFQHTGKRADNNLEGAVLLSTLQSLCENTQVFLLLAFAVALSCKTRLVENGLLGRSESWSCRSVRCFEAFAGTIELRVAGRSLDPGGWTLPRRKSGVVSNFSLRFSFLHW